jgi:hypothetical protein
VLLGYSLVSVLACHVKSLRLMMPLANHYTAFTFELALLGCLHCSWPEAYRRTATNLGLLLCSVVLAGARVLGSGRRVKAAYGVACDGFASLDPPSVSWTMGSRGRRPGSHHAARRIRFAFCSLPMVAWKGCLITAALNDLLVTAISRALRLRIT